jgi:hypothetical protein
MAAVTENNGPYKNSLGNLLVEVVDVTIAADADTYAARMQRPVGAFFVQNTDGNADAIGVNAAVSGKTVTFNHSSISSTRGTLVVYGY